MFGLPGGAILPVYDPIIDSSIRHILVRHEQGAGPHGRGVRHGDRAARRGHGDQRSRGHQHRDAAVQRLHGLDAARSWCRARWPRRSIGTDAFQECDITGVTMGITKHNWLIKDVDDIPRVVAAAFHVATTGRPGPVLDRPAQGHLERHHGVVLAVVGRRARPAGLPPGDLRRPRADRPGGRAHRPGAPARALRRRRRPEGAGRRGAARAGRPHRHPGGHHPDGPRRLPRLAPPGARHAGHARPLHRGHRHAAQRPPDQPRGPLRRPGDRQDQRLRARGQGHPRRHRPGRAGQGARARRGHRRRLPPGHRGDAAGHGRPGRPRRWSRTWRRGGTRSTSGRSGSRSTTPTPTAARSSPRTWSSSCATPSPEDTIVVAGVGQHQMWASQYWRFEHPYTWVNSGGRRHHGLRRARPPSGPRWAGPTARCGPSTATAASR